MKFRTPPQWPQPPEGWIPDPGWKPDADWPNPPRNWHFWENSYGVPIEGPPGLYGGAITRVRWTRRVITGVAGFFTLILGIAIGGVGDPEAEPSPAALANLPTHTVTVTPTAAPTVTMTAPPETVTLPPETVTLPVETVTVAVEDSASTGFGIAGGGSSASDSGSSSSSSSSGSNSGSSSGSSSGSKAGPSSVYYANCKAARAAGAAPIYRGEPGYRSGLDRDNDGVACE